MDISNLTPQRLRKAADLKERIDALQAQLDELLGGEATAPTSAAEAPQVRSNGRKRRKLSAQAIANIRAGVAKRMAKKAGGAAQSATAGNGGAEAPKKRRMSAAAKARLSALAKARWKKARAAGKSTL